MPHERPPPASQISWAYAYRLVPPQSEHRLSEVIALLEDERTHARLGERTWEGRVVRDQMVTHILVVSDTPDQDLDSNRRLEAALEGLKAQFALTVPLAVASEPVASLADPDLPVPPPVKPGRLPSEG